MLLCRLLCVALAAALAASTAVPLSAAKVDLSRLQPVPADQPIPAVDFFRQPLMQSATMNRAGTHVAALTASPQDRYLLMVQDLATKKVEFAGSARDQDVYGVSWLGDRRLIFHISTEKLWAMALCVADVGKVNRSFPVLQYGGAGVLRIPDKNPNEPYVWIRSDFETGRDEGVSLINTTAQTGPLVDLLASNVDFSAYGRVKDDNNRHILKTFPAPTGGIVIWYGFDSQDQLAYAMTAKDGFRTLHRFENRTWIKCPVDMDAIEIESDGLEPGVLLVLAPREEGKPRALRRLNVATGELGEVLVQDDEYDFNGEVLWDRQTRKVIGARLYRAVPKQIWFDPKMVEVQAALEALFPKQMVFISDWNDARTRFVVARYSDRQPVIFDWVDLEAKTVSSLQPSRPWLDSARLQPMQMLRFKTKEGKQLDAYLTLPAGTTRQNPAPLIVLPHGGPYVRDTWGFDPEVQFLASRGYAVLQPNYRGSTGRNWVFPEEDQYDFVKMREDVFAATRTALATRLIDRDRVAIMGGSFGGYLALCGAVHEPNLYRCAISIAGVFDWVAMANNMRYHQYSSPQFGWLKRRLGDPTRAKEWFENISPLRRAHEVKMPMFVAHGKDDKVVEVGQSRELISILRKNNVTHETILVGGEGHGMGHVENQVELYTRIEAFLAQHLSPCSPGSAPVAAPAAP